MNGATTRKASGPHMPHLQTAPHFSGMRPARTAGALEPCADKHGPDTGEHRRDAEHEETARRQHARPAHRREGEREREQRPEDGGDVARIGKKSLNPGYAVELSSHVERSDREYTAQAATVRNVGRGAGASPGIDSVTKVASSHERASIDAMLPRLSRRLRRYPPAGWKTSEPPSSAFTYRRGVTADGRTGNDGSQRAPPSGIAARKRHAQAPPCANPCAWNRLQRRIQQWNR